MSDFNLFKSEKNMLKEHSEFKLSNFMIQKLKLNVIYLNIITF